MSFHTPQGIILFYFKGGVMEEKLKARAIIVDDDNNVILIRYASMYMFPGGSVEQDESADIALIRELEEELGVSYEQDELTYLTAYEKT